MNDAHAVEPEEREEAQQISGTRALEDAEKLLWTRSRAALSTLSARADGWPFGSVVPFAVDRAGHPIILIAKIAEHTRNIQRDDRVSLLVLEASDAAEDVQAHGRLTVMGRASLVPEEEVADAAARYLARIPAAKDYFSTHDFSFHRISVERLRYIGGFGKIFWLDPEKYRERIEDDPIASGAERVVTHMNEDHEEAMSLWCQAFRSTTPARVRMVAVDRWGTDLVCEGPDARFRFDFLEPATPDTIRPMVVALTAAARKLVSQRREAR